MDKIRFRLLLGVGYRVLGFRLDVFAAHLKPSTRYPTPFFNLKLSTYLKELVLINVKLLQQLATRNPQLYLRDIICDLQYCMTVCFCVYSNKIIAIGGRMGKNNAYLINSSLFARYKKLRIIKYFYPTSKKIPFFGYIFI